MSDASHRDQLISDLAKLWHGWSDMRFGQMLRLALPDQRVRQLHDVGDDELAEGVRVALRESPGRPPLPGPCWDTEAGGGRTFLTGLPRDPARIQRLLDALVDASDSHPTLSLGKVVTEALDAAGVPKGERGSYALVVEDGPLRRRLVEFATQG